MGLHVLWKLVPCLKQWSELAQAVNGRAALICFVKLMSHIKTTTLIFGQSLSLSTANNWKFK